MKVMIHNNDDTDFVVYEEDTIEEIREACADRIKQPTWNNGWSEVIEK